MKMNNIFWPEGYVPGYTENFVSNEIIVLGLEAADVWPLLEQPGMWPTYYGNSANVRFHDNAGPLLRNGDRFYFETFGFPVEAQCVEYAPPPPGSLAGSRGMGGPASQAPRIGLTCTMPGSSRTLKVAASESSRRKPRRGNPPRRCAWPSPIR